MYFLQQLQKQFFAPVKLSLETANSEIYPETGETRREKTAETPDATELHTRAQRLTGNIDTTLDTSAQRQEQLQTGEVPLDISGQRVLSAVETGNIDITSPQVRAVAEDLGVGNIIDEIPVDAMQSGEINDVGTQASTPEELQGSLDAIQTEQSALEGQIATLSAGSPERIALEQRQSFLDGFSQMLQGGTPILGGGNAMANAQKYIGTQEGDGGADKFLLGMAQSARQTPWCAGFVSTVLKESGYTGKPVPTLSSTAFIGEEGNGHVAFYAGNHQMLGGNQSNSVSLAAINKPIKGWIMPEDLGKNPPNVQRTQEPQIGAIIVFERGGSSKNVS